MYSKLVLVTLTCAAAARPRPHPRPATCAAAAAARRRRTGRGTAPSPFDVRPGGADVENDAVAPERAAAGPPVQNETLAEAAPGNATGNATLDDGFRASIRAYFSGVKELRASGVSSRPGFVRVFERTASSFRRCKNQPKRSSPDRTRRDAEAVRWPLALAKKPATSYDTSPHAGFTVNGSAGRASRARRWADFKLWRKLRQTNETGTLTWHERRVRRQTPKNALRMLPLLANPLPPPFGLVLIGVASKMPRTLLTPQFWTEGQAMRFARADGADARRRHAKLLAELAATTGAPGGESPADLDLGAVGDAFGAGSALALEKLKRRHLVRLARCVRPDAPSRPGR